jgi:hypothetical protein
VRRSITIAITAFILGLFISAVVAQPQITEQAIQNLVFNSTSQALRVQLYGTTGASLITPNNNILGVTSIATAGDPTLNYQSFTGSVGAAVVVKSTLGAVYAVTALNTNASVCYIQLLNVGSTPTLGTGVIYSFGLPASAALSISFADIGTNHTTGISVGAATTRAGAIACTTAVDLNVFFK